MCCIKSNHIKLIYCIAWDGLRVSFDMIRTFEMVVLMDYAWETKLVTYKWLKVVRSRVTTTWTNPTQPNYSSNIGCMPLPSQQHCCQGTSISHSWSTGVCADIAFATLFRAISNVPHPLHVVATLHNDGRFAMLSIVPSTCAARINIAWHTVWRENKCRVGRVDCCVFTWICKFWLIASTKQ